jgi:transcriptional regulator with XRE-family HTH domain
MTRPEAAPGVAGLGARLRAKRRMRMLNQTAVARMIGVPQTTISGYELGTRIPDALQLLRLARTLGTSVGFLVGEEQDPDLILPSMPGARPLNIDLSGLEPDVQEMILSVAQFMVLMAEAREAGYQPAAEATRRLGYVLRLMAARE